MTSDSPGNHEGLATPLDPVTVSVFSDVVNYIIMYPNAKNEWQFGIRTTNGKLVGVMLAFPVCVSIGGVSITCAYPLIANHPKYSNKRLWYVLIKELLEGLISVTLIILFSL